MATAEIRTEKIAGGFVLIDAAELLHAWRSCQDREPGAGGFRAWLACREMIARRRGIAGGRSPHFDLAEMARLTGTTERTVAASVRRLVAAGLLEWTEDAIAFPDHPPDPAKMIEDTIIGGRGAVTIPRRLLRFLARGARPALIATALAALLRCVSRRRAGFTSAGRMACSWVARTFGIDLRRVKQARAELVALGWLSPEPSPTWTSNRWGAAWTVNLGWKPSMVIMTTPGPREDCHPSEAGTGASLPPPDLTPIPYREESNPEPAGRGPAGASLGQEEKTSMPPAPSLRDIRPTDLADTARVIELHRQAVAAGKITASEADRVRFMAAAEHARAIGTSNPPGLLARIVSTSAWHLLTQGDEDRAARRLREHQRPGPAPTSRLATPSSLPIRSPYGAERPSREPTTLGSLLARLATGAGPT